jgi:hypothetical protein
MQACYTHQKDCVAMLKHQTLGKACHSPSAVTACLHRGHTMAAASKLSLLKAQTTL